MWWATWTVILCGLLEITGWAGRLWSSINVGNGDAFQMQYVPVVLDHSYMHSISRSRIVATIIGPTPLLAAIFIIFGRLIRLLGLSYSRFSPRMCKCSLYMVNTVSNAFLLFRHLGLCIIRESCLLYGTELVAYSLAFRTLSLSLCRVSEEVSLHQEKPESKPLWFVV